MIEAMKQALDALGAYMGATDKEEDEKAHSLMAAAFFKLKEAIAEAEKQEPVAWRNAAIRVGEELSSVGPNGYYDMTAEQWLNWAVEQEPKGKTSLPQSKAEKQEPVAWMHTKIDGVAITHKPIDLKRHPERWVALYKDPTPCKTCEALARTVMMDQTAHDTRPQPAAWVGLSNGEMIELTEMELGRWDLILEVEEKLRERNT